MVMVVVLFLIAKALERERGVLLNVSYESVARIRVQKFLIT